MSGYTKLFQSILDSTIWQESNETRLLWITMLAMSDKNGEVQAAIPGLAKRAGITIQECEHGLLTLLSPDPYSRTPDHEGRRIEVIDGGWSLLNHAKYRELMSYEERKEYNRRKQAEFRAKKANGASKDVNDMSITVNHSQSQSAMSAHNKSKRQKAKDKTEETPLTPKGELPFPSDFSEERKESFRLWLKHKKEKGQNYKPTGWETMLAKFAHLSDYDLDASIRNSMANNYSGIFQARGQTAEPSAPSKPKRLPANWREIAEALWGHPVECNEEDLTPDQWGDVYRNSKP
jgi:hypothetical protein